MRRGSGMEYKIFREPLLFSGARVKRRGKRDVLISALEDVFFFSRLKRRRMGGGGVSVCVCVCDDDEVGLVGRTVGQQQCVWHRADEDALRS